MFGHEFTVEQLDLTRKSLTLGPGSKGIPAVGLKLITCGEGKLHLLKRYEKTGPQCQFFFFSTPMTTIEDSATIEQTIPDTNKERFHDQCEIAGRP